MSRGPDYLKLDQEAREQALAPDSFIVQAPAGAGKTELLTQRFLRLLASVQAPEEIIAITFTNKAAAEMRARILTSLEMAARGDLPSEPHKLVTLDLARSVLATDARLDWGLLQHPDDCRSAPSMPSAPASPGRCHSCLASAPSRRYGTTAPPTMRRLHAPPSRCWKGTIPARTPSPAPWHISTTTAVAC